ncbi:16234_t:CDS:2, partial [Racocetra persica]
VSNDVLALIGPGDSKLWWGQSEYTLVRINAIDAGCTPRMTSSVVPPTRKLCPARFSSGSSCLSLVMNQRLVAVVGVRSLYTDIHVLFPDNSNFSAAMVETLISSDWLFGRSSPSHARP